MKKPTGARFLATESTARRLRQAALDAGSDPGDFLELALLAALPPTDGPEATLAGRLLERVRSGDTVDLTQAAAAAPTRIMLLRMGPPRPAAEEIAGEGDLSPREAPLETFDDGYPRRWIGMDIHDRPGDVWQAARGYWRAAPGASYLVPVRLGYAPFVFRVDTWSTRSNGRAWARSGWWVRPDDATVQRLDEPAAGSHAPRLGEVVPATEQDLAVAGALAGRMIRLGKKSTNPVIPIGG